MMTHAMALKANGKKQCTRKGTLPTPGTSITLSSRPSRSYGLVLDQWATAQEQFITFYVPLLQLALSQS